MMKMMMSAQFVTMKGAFIFKKDQNNDTKIINEY